MADPKDRINQLRERLDVILSRQMQFSKEIEALKQDIRAIQDVENTRIFKEETAEKESPVFTNEPKPEPEKEASPLQETVVPQPEIEEPQPIQKPKKKSDLEKFIGENLISKIGIVIIVIGVGIGAKYSIENELISPLTRIILGYLMGIGLIGFGVKLKKNYENLSAVLVSGAITILYFITFFAHSFYGLIPQSMAFALMVLFTVFAVVAAINYNKQIIALLGLVGAYAVPYLLSDGSGNILVLFCYMAIINMGILVLAFKKYWKSLYYAAFTLTWLIYFTWYALDYSANTQFGIAFTFLSIFFISFYLTFLAYKLLKKEQFKRGDIVVLLLNSFIYFGLGYALLMNHETGNQLLGVFALGNAVIHFLVSALIYKYKLADNNIFYLVSGLVLVFLTIAIPVQLDGNWVTLLWVAEALLLFWIGRSKAIPVYERLSYPLMLLAFFSLLQDWAVTYEYYYYLDDAQLKPFFNIQFLSSLIFTAGFGVILFLNNKKGAISEDDKTHWTNSLFNYVIPAIFLFVLYNTFRLEIANYWNNLYLSSEVTLIPDGETHERTFRNYNYNDLKVVWSILYTVFFMSALAFFNIKKLKHQVLGYINLGLNSISILVYLTGGLYVLSEMRARYLDIESIGYFDVGLINLWLRYVSYLFVALILYTCFRYLKATFMTWKFKIGFDFLLHITILWTLSSELLHWLDIAGVTQTYKLGLSILLGIYALSLIVLGIFSSKKHLRVGGILLFGLTLLKLFFFDLTALDTIGKTIVFVVLGVLLLISSYLYTKYKDKIVDENS